MPQEKEQIYKLLKPQLTPKEMLNQIRVYLKENLINIVGGCCGTTYEHIRLIAEEVKKFKPRKVK